MGMERITGVKRKRQHMAGGRQISVGRRVREKEDEGVRDWVKMRAGTLK